MRVGERHCPPACLRRLQDVERSDSGRRAGECLRFRRGRAWPRSGVQRIETPESGSSAATVCEAIGEGTDAQERASSPEQLIRSLPPPRSGRAGRALRRELRKHSPPGMSVSEARPALCRARGALPVSRLRRAGNAAQRSRSLRSVRESGVDVPVRSGVRLPRRKSPAMVRGAAGTRSVSDSARSRVLDGHRTHSAVCDGRSDCSVEDCASRGRSSESRRQTRCLVRARSASCPGEPRSGEVSLRRQRALETFANPDGWNALRRSNVERRNPRAL